MLENEDTAKGMCATLINMGYISWQDGQKDEAMHKLLMHLKNLG